MSWFSLQSLPLRVDRRDEWVSWESIWVELVNAIWAFTFDCCSSVKVDWLLSALLGEFLLLQLSARLVELQSGRHVDWYKSLVVYGSGWKFGDTVRIGRTRCVHLVVTRGTLEYRCLRWLYTRTRSLAWLSGIRVVTLTFYSSMVVREKVCIIGLHTLCQTTLTIVGLLVRNGGKTLATGMTLAIIKGFKLIVWHVAFKLREIWLVLGE